MATTTNHTVSIAFSVLDKRNVIHVFYSQKMFAGLTALHEEK